MAIARTVVFIACHAGPADHFATFAEKLTQEQGVDVCVHASTGVALKKFQDREIKNVQEFTLTDLSDEQIQELAQKIAKTCKTASAIITDIGHRFNVAMQEALHTGVSEEVPIYVYYDNPEAFVPGGYSENAAQVIAAAPRAALLFTNAKLSREPIYRTPELEIPCGFRPKIGLGFYPAEQVASIAERRNAPLEVARLRKNVLGDDQGQTILSYFGGNNVAYDNALPAFFEMLEEVSSTQNLSNYVIFFQQHPTAKKERRDTDEILTWQNKFAQLDKAPKIILSEEEKNDTAQIVAQAAFYYQTSMSPQFILAGIPTIQVGRDTYSETLVNAEIIPSITRAEALKDQLSVLDSFPLPEPERVQDLVGLSDTWYNHLRNTLIRG